MPQAIDWAIQMFGPGSIFHLLHVVPEPQVRQARPGLPRAALALQPGACTHVDMLPQMLHLWAGTYIPPEDDAELIEARRRRLWDG